MDGVLVTGSRAIPGAPEFIGRLKAAGAPFLVLTNNSRYTPDDLRARLASAGLDIPHESLFTSALATAHFLSQQRPGGSAYAVGETGVLSSLKDIGFVLTEHNPEYVVLGETVSYSIEQLTHATRLVAAGARFVATNPDVVGPSEGGIHPACGAVAALITAATGVKAYFIGKPNPLMMRLALQQIGVHSREAIMVGDRMDTDIVAGTEAGMETILVLSGVTRKEDVDRFPYRPARIVGSVADIRP
ncbi:MAG: HAD-IIA family hydrolase [Nitrospirales bacterium]